MSETPAVPVDDAALAIFTAAVINVGWGEAVLAFALAAAVVGCIWLGIRLMDD